MIHLCSCGLFSAGHTEPETAFLRFYIYMIRKSPLSCVRGRDIFVCGCTSLGYNSRTQLIFFSAVPGGNFTRGQAKTQERHNSPTTHLFPCQSLLWANARATGQEEIVDLVVGDAPEEKRNLRSGKGDELAEQQTDKHLPDA